MIDDSDLALILLTKDGFNSNFVHQEIGYVQKAQKRRIIVVEKGYESKVTGFIYGNDYISYMPDSPDVTISQIKKIILQIYNHMLKEIENLNLLVGIGIFLGALF